MALQDKIGREEIVNKICGLVDSLQKDQNFCLSINGAWGSGKSFVLQMIEEQLSKKQEYVIVKYDAWENTFYSDPLIAMLYCILDTLQSESSDALKESITTKRVKMTTTNVAKQVGEVVVETLAENNKIVNFIKNAIIKIQSVIKLYKETALTNNAQSDDYKSYSKFLKETIKQLNEITTQEFYEGKQTKLIVLVDEIDRCLPDEQLKILERMHHLFDIKNCAVIVAINREAIKSTFDRNYGGNSEDYLRKFFQYNFELITYATVLLKNRLKDMFYEINDKRNEVIINDVVDFLINDVTNIIEDLISDKTRNIDNRYIEKYIADIKCITKNLINYHPAILWFVLRLKIYRMFEQSLYKKITDENNCDLIFLNELESFLGLKNEYTSIGSWQFMFNGAFVDVRYTYYSNTRYNDILYLFNLCRFRNNTKMIETYLELVKNNIFINEKVQTLINQIKEALNEMELYGDR